MQSRVYGYFYLRMFLAYVSFCFCIYANAEVKGNFKKTDTKQEEPKEQEPKLQLTAGLAEVIHSGVVNKQAEAQSQSSSFDGGLRLYQLESFQLKNKYFTVDYEQERSPWIGLQLTSLIHLATTGLFENSTFFRLGYLYKQGIFEVDSDVGIKVRDSITLQSIPLQVGFETSSKPVSFLGIRYGFSVATGMNWISQNGELDGMTQSFWIPHYEIGPRLTLFSRKANQIDGFDGVGVGYSVFSNFASKQLLRGQIVDLGGRYVF